VHSTRLDAIAKHLIAGYLDTAVYSRRFFEEHHSPPTLMAKIHHMRSVVQADLQRDDDYELRGLYAEFGRVAFTELATGDEFALRGLKAIHIERAKYEQPELPLNVASLMTPSVVQLLVYEFVKEGLNLSVANAARREGRRRIEAVGTPTFIGQWPYVPGDAEIPFDQSGDNAWDFLGDIGDIGEDDAGQAQ
jgi:hypothetical protein